MLRHTPRWSELRFYDEQSDEVMPDYSAACNLIWVAPTIVWVSMLNGTLTRRMLREFVRFLVEHRIEYVRADRAPGRLLPLFRRCDGYFEMAVADAVRYGLRNSA